MAEQRSRWPFAPTDGTAASRPRVVDLEGMVVAILADDEAAVRAGEALRAIGYTDETLRMYTSAEIVANDEAFKASRRLRDRIVSSVVDDTDAMERYVGYAREGRAALWVRTQDRTEAKQVVRLLADNQVVFVSYYGRDGVETMQVK